MDHGAIATYLSPVIVFLLVTAPWAIIAYLCKRFVGAFDQTGKLVITMDKRQALVERSVKAQRGLCVASSQELLTELNELEATVRALGQRQELAIAKLFSIGYQAKAQGWAINPDEWNLQPSPRSP